MNMSTRKSAKKRRTETTEDRLEDLDTTENTAEVNETSMMSLTIPRVETAVSSEVPESLATLSKFELQEREIAIHNAANIAWSEILTILLNQGYTKQEVSLYRKRSVDDLFKCATIEINRET